MPVLPRFLKNKIASTKSLGYLLAAILIGFIMLYKPSSPQPTPTVASTEKKPSHWLKLSHLGNLQSIEIQAKKEQLEKDLTLFEPVLQATVALSQEEDSLAEISVILSLPQASTLSPSLVHSITDYLTRSVPGLTKEHITLSDQHGNLYSPLFEQSNTLLTTSLERSLQTILPQTHFALNYIPVADEGHLQLLVDEDYLNTLPKGARVKLLSHMQEILSAFSEMHPSVDIVPFLKPVAHKTSRLSSIVLSITIVLLSLGILGFATFYLAFHTYDHVSQQKEKIQSINIPKLIEMMKRESPEKVALILSYLDSAKAEELLNKLPEEMKSAVLKLRT
ncbi:type III secretion system protein [Chlamydia trachomatis]|uniref:Flagellar M-Ring Protein n=2 Tax=Chlamydia trachomatis TaxID=813 RepID=A0A6H2W0T2_CHLTB|nr:type III secretion system protein [Chlamydia trachomatis]AGJ64174.1 type III secretion system protein [Chlamydia trachomatis L2/434/Bu(i)]AGJ65114.1 type III secretion system protein [Chlamydia trachomatis L2/434/Bu(f)]AGR94162.1 type III secretion system protein [Chlamydia trachomatis RC-F/69]AGR95087.1 type III secretion system protein [Chlamydia trachomatis RC-L2(s)/46]AGR96012.1 type III secretion system protein [Chlamydia trachomatis RC-F(s)/852]